jgi:hypothetical protein
MRTEQQERIIALATEHKDFYVQRWNALGDLKKSNTVFKLETEWIQERMDKAMSMIVNFEKMIERAEIKIEKIKRQQAEQLLKAIFGEIK